MEKKYNNAESNDHSLTVEVFTAVPEGFQVTSTLVYGEKELILIDAQFLLSEGRRLAETIAATGKKLKTIFITHGHPDHYWGLNELKKIFPGAKILAAPQTIEQIQKLQEAELARWKPIYGDKIPDQPIVPEPLREKQLEIEGNVLGIISGLQGDDRGSSLIWIPSKKTVITGDIVYDNVPLWVMETDKKARKKWIKSLEKIMALDPETVIGGHTELGSKHQPSSIYFTKRYLEAFDKLAEEAHSREEFISKIRAAFPQLNGLETVLEMSADMMFPKRKG